MRGTSVIRTTTVWKERLKLAVILIFVYSLPANAASAEKTWTLSPEVSRIAFVSIKAEQIGETNHFRKIEGTVSPDGRAEITVRLSSVETRIDIRNERMRNLFFETEQFPKAVISAQLDLPAYEKLSVGERITGLVEFDLSLHGVNAPFEATVFVTRIGRDAVLIETVEPLVLDVNQFSLGDGLTRLKEAAGLPSISPAVPVTASLVFER